MKENIISLPFNTFNTFSPTDERKNLSRRAKSSSENVSLDVKEPSVLPLATTVVLPGVSPKT